MKRESGKAGRLRIALIAAVSILSLSLLFNRCDAPSRQLGSRYSRLTEKAAGFRSGGDYERARRAYRGAFEEARRAGAPLEMAASSMSLGLVAWDLGNIQEASEYLAEASSMSKAAGATELESACAAALRITELYALGRQARSANDHAASIAHFDQAIEMSREAQLPSMALKCLRQKGSTYWHQGLIEPYLECNLKALDVARQLHHRKEEARCLNNIGAFFTRKKDPYRALGYFERARELAAAEHDESTLAECLTNMATTYMDLGNYERAENLALAAYSVDRSLDDRDAIIMDLNNLASINMKIAQRSGRREDLEAPLRFLRESLSMLRTQGPSATKVQVMNNIAALHFLRDEFDPARHYFTESLEAARSLGYPWLENACLMNLGLVAFQADETERAMSILGQVTRAASVTDDAGVLWEAHYGLGLCLERIRDPEAALQAYRESIRAIESSRKPEDRDIYKIGFTGDRFAPYQKAVDILFAEYASEPNTETLEDIFSIMERAKARALVEGIEPEIAGAGDGSRVRGIAYVQSHLLDERDLLIEYFLGDSRSYVVTITKSEARIFGLPGQERISRSIKAYLKYLASPPGPLPTANKASMRLGRELLFPLERMRIKDIGRIIVIPDGALSYLPFETLSPATHAAGRPLVEDYDVHYGVSASSLCALKGKRPRERWEKTLLAVGGAAYGKGRERPSALPLSGREVQEITNLFPEHLRDVFSEKDAIEENIKALPLDVYRIIHFAGHGLSDGPRPFRSALLLAPGPRGLEDGALRMEEIAQLRLSAELVVLSACRTGSGAFERSEGPLSLARSFLFAGARAVLASLWDVSDGATTELMKRFYAYLLEGQDTSRALRSAKIEMLRSDLGHPFYWAGFILSGYPAAPTVLE